MRGMKITGPLDRARVARNAVNRLRHEVDAVLDPNLPVEHRHDYEIPGTVGEIAEIMGILANIMKTLDERLPADHPSRGRLGEMAPVLPGLPPGGAMTVTENESTNDIILGFRGLEPYLADAGKLVNLLVDRRNMQAVGLGGLLAHAYAAFCTQAPDDPEDYRMVPPIEPVPMFAVAWIEDPGQAVARGWSHCEETCNGAPANEDAGVDGNCLAPVGFYLDGHADQTTEFAPFALVVDDKGAVTRLCEECAAGVIYPRGPAAEVTPAAETPACGAYRKARGDEPCDGPVDRAVTYRSATSGTLLDHTPACARHAIAEETRAAAAATMARVAVEPLAGITRGTT